MNYDEFLRNKLDYGANSGFEPTFIPDYLFDFQKSLTEWIVKKGRGAVFADCGLGKTIMQLVWAQNVLEHTNKSVLVLTPLAVSYQTLEEAERFGIEAYQALDKSKPKASIQVINYQKLHYLDNENFGGVVCDESSILKNEKGKTKDAITEFMRLVPYRSLWTATAAPNDWDELGTSSEALGYYGYMDMINKFFVNNQNSSATIHGRFIMDKFRLKAWAEKGPFWQWIVSWARALRKPSDIGFNDDGFVLPELNINDVRLIEENVKQGMLFDLPAKGISEERDIMKRTVKQRCEEVAKRVSDKYIALVWCNRNDEADLLRKIIPNSVEIRGNDNEEKRIETVRWFLHSNDSQKILISKPRIFGFGMNFQNCNYMTYFPTHSYEQFYQSVRRVWRFGQKNNVTVDRIYTRGFDRIVHNLDRKSENVDKMFDKLVKYMNDALDIQRKKYVEMEVSLPQWLMQEK